MMASKEEVVEELCVEEKKWVSGNGNVAAAADVQDRPDASADWWRSRHHDLCLAQILLGLVHVVRVALPLCLAEDLRHLLPSANMSKIARLISLPLPRPAVKNLMPYLYLVLQSLPLLALPSQFSAISAGLRKHQAPLISLQMWLLLLCIVPSILSTLLLLPLFLQPVPPGPQALLCGQPLHLIWAGVDFLTAALGILQLFVSRRIVFLWGDQEKKAK